MCLLSNTLVYKSKIKNEILGVIHFKVLKNKMRLKASIANDLLSINEELNFHYTPT